VELIADLHIHSRFSRATSRDLNLVALHRSALAKGISLVGTGDFTHPGWLAEITEQLEPAEGGLLRLRPELARQAAQGVPGACGGEVRFVLQVEISNIYKKDGRVRKNHNLIYMPSLEAVGAFNQRLAAIGNLGSDGRPILGLDARDLLEIVLETDPEAFLIPAHIWTPWFSMLGSKSGFDSLEECFGDLSGHVYAVETGLSSDPPMSWRLSALDHLTLVSSSDAHSAAKLGREANLLDIEPSFGGLRRAVETGAGFLGTLEFYPEEGKYHLDGHRKCGLRLSPDETRELGGRCPRCGGLITVGVMSRVDELADRPQEDLPNESSSEGSSGVSGSASAPAWPARAAGFEHLVPLEEVVAQVAGVGAGSKRVAAEVQRLRERLGPDLVVLRQASLEDIAATCGPGLAEAVRRVRSGELEIAGGYDGEFGTVQIFAEGELDHLFGQLDLLGRPASAGRPRPRRRSSEPTTDPGTARDDRALDCLASDRSSAGATQGAESGCATPAQSTPLTSQASPTGLTLDDPCAGLDADQREAVDAEGPLLVVAGPGTGKTRTLVARIADRLRRGELEPAQVLALTFTNQAADELRQRLGTVTSADSQVLATTFHGLGLRLLAELEGREPEMLDEAGRLELAGRISGTSGSRAEHVLGRISLARQSPDPSAACTGEPELSQWLDAYQAELSSRGLVDVDDLVLQPARLLGQDPEAAAALASRYRLVAVDEYQDVNDVQAELVRLLSPDGHSLMVIGDPDQAIYGFRGARPGHFRRFAEVFPGAHRVTLGTSYRLTREILAVARGLVQGRDELRALRSGPRVELVGCPSPASEAEQILVRLERILGGSSSFAVGTGRGGDAELQGVGLGDVAVLCRTRAQRAEILTALGRSGIPCREIGEDEPHDPRSEKVAIMTMHAAKGREHEVVFVAGVEQGLVPLDLDGLLSDPEEERRLLFVAITRARRLAVLSYAARRSLWGRTLPGGPSRFLADLPSDAVHRRQPDLPRRDPASEQLRLF